MTGNEDEIDYDHSLNLHRTEDSRIALRIVFPDRLPESILDVGCGAGTWLRNIAAAGVTDYIGVDGVDIPPAEMLFDRSHFIRQNLGAHWDLGRRFEAALCLEVAEHLDESCAETLVDGLVRHSDLIVFSAACPGQPGQHHVNCQWPDYWQRLFNARGYLCDDAVRWRLWDLPGVDPWYKQNMFIARRSPDAGREPRMRSVMHPEMFLRIGALIAADASSERAGEIVRGGMPAGWYIRTFLSAFAAKVLHKIFGNGKLM